ncbi:phosphoribosylformylglycinamidine synthase I [Candidatus Bathyarchaeota archaeon]|nr:MAG: phosphoribosylformylglycinamidine synthase I [Candidatus Bathyarchaeota archaeon]TMI45138.1 MAG: phosphoribosylformylglycinamidine synthase I [Candidatus Bathyarchaeota archaeon]
MVKVAVVQFPGSNCDLDALEILQKTVKVPTDLVWHKDLKEDQYDAYVLPGGFSYGDYLRAGAIAATSPSLETIREATVAGKPVLGICNGFQILVEAGILLGAVLRNAGLRFVCKWTRLRVESTRTPFTNLAKKGQTLRIPIAHNEGRYYLDNDQLAELERNKQIVLRYVNETNIPTKDSNPNGSLDNIAGICNKEGNVMGLMPHPERASLPILSLNNQPDGRLIFDSMIRSFENTVEGENR